MHRGAVWLLLAGCGRVGFDAAPIGDGQPADTIDAALPPADALPPCTKLAFSDNFDDGVRAATWTLLANNPVTVAEAGGQLQVTLASSGGSHYGGYDSAATWDLRDHCMSVAFVGVPAAEAMVEMTFSARPTAGTATGIVLHGGLLDPFVNTGTFTSLGAVPYDAAMHRVMLIREDAGTMTYETSPDGVTFTVLAQAPAPFALSAVTVVLESGTFGSAPSPGTALYDDFDAP